MHSKSVNKEIMINDKAKKVIKKLFKSLLNKYQNNLKTLTKNSDFVLDYIHLLQMEDSEFVIDYVHL